MKTLSEKTEAALAAGGWDVVYFCRVTWPGDSSPSYYSTRNSFSVAPGVTLNPILQGLPEFSRSVALGAEQSQPVSESQFSLLNLPEDGNRLEIKLETQEPQGVLIEWFKAFRPVDGSALAETDWIALDRLTIDRCWTERNSLVFSMVPFSIGRGEKPVGNVITDADFPTAPHEAYGQVIPHIWGTVEDCRCPLVDSGRSTQLDGALDAEDTILFVSSVEGFPASGMLLLDEEEIAYASLNASLNCFGSASSPCQRGANGTTVAAHTDGSTVREKLSTYRFLVANHAVQSVGNVRVGGKAVTGEPLTDTDAQGQTRTYIQTAALPTVEELASTATDVALDAVDGGWSVGAGSDAAEDAAKAIDAGDDRHASAAVLQGSAGKRNLRLNYTKNQTTRPGKFSGAWLEVEYQVVPGEGRQPGESVQWGNPSITVSRGGAVVKTSALTKPREEDFAGYLDDATPGLSLDDSRPLFNWTQVAVSTFKGFGAYASGYARWTGTKRVSRNDYPWGLTAWFQASNSGLGKRGQNYQWDTGGTVPDDARNWAWMAARTALGITLNPNAADVAGNPVIHAVRVSFTARTGNVGGTSGDAALKLALSGLGRTCFVDITEEEYTAEFELILPSGTTANDVKATTFRLYVESGAGESPRPWMFYYSDFTADIAVAAKQTGADTPLGGSVDPLNNLSLAGASSRLVQKVGLTQALRTGWANPWDFFNGTVSVLLTDASSCSTKILVYDVRFVVSERALTRRAMNDAEIICLADVTGLAPSGSPEDVITSILTGADYWALDESGYDAASLTAALNGRDGWLLARRLHEVTDCKSLLESVCFCAGIKPVHEGGLLSFVPIDTPVWSATASLALAREDLLESPRKSPLPLDLVANSIRLYFARSSSSGNFARTREAESLYSQSQAWGKRYKVFDAEWIRDGATAQQLCSVLLGVMAWPGKSIITETGLNGCALEIGDIVQITDAPSRLDAVRGKVVALSIPGGKRVRMNLLVSGVRVRVWERTGDTTTYIDVYPQNLQMVFAIGGVIVATVDGGGRWRIAGQWRETDMDNFGVHYGTEAIEYWTGATKGIHLGISTGTPGNYYTGIVLTPAGDVLSDSAHELGEEITEVLPGARTAYIGPGLYTSTWTEVSLNLQNVFGYWFVLPLGLPKPVSLVVGELLEEASL